MSEVQQTTPNLKPLGDRILVKRTEEDTTSAGGIIIPDTAKEASQKATVVAVGPGKVLDNGTTQKLSVKAGDAVLFSKYGGSEVDFDGEKYLIVREDDILGVLN
jgi:chaperonin GroES